MLSTKRRNIEKLFREHHFVMSTAELTEAKLYYADIQALLNEGVIEKIRRGYYQWIENYHGSEVVVINRLFPDGVLCMETALFYYGYSDRTPDCWHIAIDKRVSKLRTKIDYPFCKAYRMETTVLLLGKTTGTIDSYDIHIYDRDRTLCDVLRNRNKMDSEIFHKAIQRYIQDPKKNIPNLMYYAKELRLLKKVKEMIGVWL